MSGTLKMASFSKTVPAFPPDFCSAETRSHRLDCSVSTVHSYVRRGLLPKPSRLGDLVRWRWADVERFIDELEKLPTQADADDPYLASLAGTDRGSSSEADD
jgi:predicted DNA-binding transcriptional regulator AlpA